jgi:hypothetical protein
MRFSRELLGRRVLAAGISYGYGVMLGRWVAVRA